MMVSFAASAMASAAAAAEDPHFFVELTDKDKSRVLLLPFGVKNEDQSIFLHKDHSTKLDDLPALVAEGAYTSIVIMSHGWNTTPFDGRAMYRDWFSYLQAVNADADGNELGAKPLYIGIYWPSIILAPTWDKYMENPKIVADAARLEAKEIAARIAEATGRPEEAERVERALARGENGVVDALLDYPNVDYDSSAQTVGTPINTKPELSSDPVAKEKVRKALKAAVEGKALKDMVPPRSAPLASLAQNLTLGPMKKRAGEIGASTAFQTFLKDQAFATGKPVHLMGHSLGCKVMLEAVAKLGGSHRPQSLTLIQAAVSRWCFSKRVVVADPFNPRQAPPGIYHAIPEAVQTPILVLYSEKDVALRAMSAFLFGNVEKEAVVRGAEDLYESIGAVSPGAALGAHGPDFHETDGVLLTMFHKIKTPLYLRAGLTPVPTGLHGPPPKAEAGGAAASASSAPSPVSSDEPRAAPPGDAVRIVGVKGGWGHCYNKETGGWSDKATAMTVWHHMAKGVIWDA